MIINYNRLGCGRDTWLKKDVGDKVLSPPPKQIPRTRYLFTLILFLLFIASPRTFSQVIVGSGNTTSAVVPFYSYYGYSYVQQIYLQSQISATGSITTLTFTQAGVLPTTAGGGATTPQEANTSFRIYLGHTAKTSFSSNTDWIPVASMQLVFDGNITMPTTVGQSITITLDTPFPYNNTDNLVLAIDENSTGYANSDPTFTATGYSWVASSGQTNRVLYYNSDSTNPNPSSPPTGTRTNVTARVTLGGLTPPPPGCASSFSPADASSGIQRNPTLSWAITSGASAYDVYFGTSSPPPFSGTTNAASYVVPGPLDPQTTYYWQVLPKNVSGSASDCSIQSFTTGDNVVYCVPTMEYGCTDGDVIARVTLNTLDNNSGTGCPSGFAGYSDYTTNPALTTTLQAGTVYGCTVYAGQYSQGYAAWIDYNDDGTFGPDERIGYSVGLVTGSGSAGVLGSSATFPIALACNPPVGNHRLRIRSMYDTSGIDITPCNDYQWGEIEDYIITISEPAACPQPSGLASSLDEDTGEYTLTWNAGCVETAWELVIQDAGSGTPAGSGVSASSPYVIQAGDLTPGVKEFYVRANCQEDGYSLWTGPMIFTRPGCSTEIAPANGATGVPIINGDAVNISWTASPGAISYDVYWGDAPDDVFWIGNIGATSVNVTGLTFSQTNYWQIVPISDLGEAIGCEVWSFTTEAPPAHDTCEGAISLDELESPINGSTINMSNDFSPLCNTSNAPDVYYKITVPPFYTLSIGNSSSDYDSQNTILYGTCDSLTQIECVDDPEGTILEWTNDTGSTQTVYWIQDAYSTNAGNFTLAWSLTPPPIAINSLEPSAICSADLDGGILTISGQFFTGTTEVTINGEPHEFEVMSDTQMVVTLTPETTTGIVAITSDVSEGESIDTFVVNVNPVVQEITYTGDNVICVGDVIDMNSVTPAGTWSSSDHDVAVVDGNGIVTAVGPGTVTISYSVTDNGCTTSVTADVSVSAPIESTNPGNQSVVTGTTAVFSVTATGDIDSYQWMVSTDYGETFEPISDDVHYSGSNTNTLTISETPETFHEYLYMVYITASGPCADFTSAPAFLQVGETGINTHPENVSLCGETDTANFSVVASGTVDSYEWYVDPGLGPELITDGTFGNVTFSGATTNVLTVSGIDVTNSGWIFSVLVVGPANSILSNQALLTVNTSPGLTASPMTSSVCSSGGGTSFDVEFNGTITGITWQYATSQEGPFANVVNGTPAGATYSVNTVGTTSTLNVTTTAATPAAGTYYYRAVGNTVAPCLPVYSEPAQMQIVAPVITSQPTAKTGSSGMTVSYTVATSSPAPNYQWQYASSPAGPFNDVVNGTPTGVTYSGADSDVLNVTIGTTATTSNQRYYRAMVVSDDCITYSNPAQLTITSYCNPAPTSMDGNGITNFTMGTINNTTGGEPSYYGNYANLSTDVVQGTTVPFSITYSTGYTYGTKIWIDFNKDGDFVDAGEQVYVGLSESDNPTTLAGTINIPLNAPVGPTRLRIGGTDTDTGPNTPCYTGAWASFEDYSINILPAPACDGTPTAGTVTSNITGICVSGTATLTATGYSTGLTGVSLQWYNSQGLIPGANNPTYTTPVLTSAESYFLRVTCNNSGEFADSNTVVVSVDSPTIVTTEPGTRCGTGTVTLGATASSGATPHWYTVATGGVPVASGETFVTPSLNATTTYYVSAGIGYSSGAAGYVGAIPSNNGLNMGEHGILLTTTQPNIRINSAMVAFTGTGTITVTLRSGSGSGGAIVATATSPSVSGSGTTPVNVPLGLTIPSPGNYTLMITSVSGTVNSLGYVSGSFPYTTLGGAFAITSGYWYGSDPSLMYLVNLNVSQGCVSGRTPVVATVEESPALALSHSSINFCEGTSSAAVTITEGGEDYDTYMWSPATGVSGDAASGFTFNPAVSTVYTLTASNEEGCVNIVNLSVNVDPLPTAMTISPESPAVCSVGSAVQLSVSGGSILVLAEDFNNDAPTWTRTNGPSSPAQSNWAYVSTPYTYSTYYSNFSTVNGGKFAVVNGDAGGSGSTTNSQLVSPVFSTVGLTSATLTFEHVYRSWASGDNTVQVQISTNGGTTWSTLMNYIGNTQGSTSATAPASISLNSYLNQPNLRIRYNYISSWGFEWMIDDVKVTGIVNPVWSPTEGLYTDAGATVPYDGSPAVSVYAKPESTTMYTASITSGGGCLGTQSTTVTYMEAIEYYADADGDGYGDANTPIMACAASAGVVANNTDCDDTKASVHPGATEIGYNLIDDDCDGSIDEGFPPITNTPGPAYCNITLDAIDQQIHSYIIPGAQGYQWRVTTLSGPNAGQVQYLNTVLRTMKLTQLANYAYNATYQIDVAVYYQGYLQPYTESNCTVTTPTPTTQLGNCDATLTTIGDVIYAYIVPYATGYRFRITDPVNPANTQEIDRVTRDFRLNLVTAFPVQYNKTYNIEVAPRNTDGTFLPYGSVCSVTTSMFPTTSLGDSQCDDGLGGAYAVPAMSTPIYAFSYPGAIAYGFRLTGPGLAGGQAEVVKQVRSFTLNDFAGMGLVPGADYNVNVRLIFNAGDPAGPYGKTCTIKVPGSVRMKAVEFNAVAYPNPFSEGFNIDITTSNSDQVSVKVFDMAGRLLEDRTATVSQTETVTLGERYPAGVYNVIVTQNDDVKTLRVIKR